MPGSHLCLQLFSISCLIVSVSCGLSECHLTPRRIGLMLVGVKLGNVTRLSLHAAVSNMAFVGNPSDACKNLTISFVEGNSYTLIADSAISRLGDGVRSWASGTIQRPSIPCHHWITVGELIVSQEFMASWTVAPPS